MSGGAGDHLFDQVRPWLARPVDERIAFIRAARWIAYERALAAHAMLDDLIARPASLRTVGLMLLGPFANGKSMIAERFALAHLKKAEAIGEPSKVFVAQTREGAGLLNFYEGILSALQAPRTRARWACPRHYGRAIEADGRHARCDEHSEQRREEARL